MDRLLGSHLGYIMERAMNLDDLLQQLDQLTPEQYGYLDLRAIFGPLVLRCSVSKSSRDSSVH
jgi:hypothetical protein